MRHALRLTLLILATSCASRANAAGPHVFDPDGPRLAPQHRVTPPHSAPVRAKTPTHAPTATTRTPAPVVRPAPSVSIEPPPPPGMNILRHMMRHTLTSPLPRNGRRDARSQAPFDEGWVL